MNKKDAIQKLLKGIKDENYNTIVTSIRRDIRKGNVSIEDMYKNIRGHELWLVKQNKVNMRIVKEIPKLNKFEENSSRKRQFYDQVK